MILNGYYLIDKKLFDYYITEPKYVAVMSLIMAFICFIISFFLLIFNLFFILCMILCLLCLIIFFINKKKFMKKLVIDNSNVIVYNSKNKFKTIDLHSLKITHLNIAFSYIKGFINKNCLVLYKDIEIYDGMEYRSYYKDPNILIIQNPELIAIIEQKFKEIN